MTAPTPSTPRPSMSLWRLELLRLTRTRRWIAPVAIYTLFGLAGPATERYLADIISRFGGVEVALPAPTPAGGFAQYVSNVSQLGVLAIVVIAATALTVDQPPEMGIFLRTRVRSARDLVLPRIVTTAVLAVVAWTLGTGAAWYETWVLLGSVSPIPVLVGLAYGGVFLVFVVSLVAFVASFGHTTMATAFTSMAILVLLPIIGLVPVTERWVPSELVGALDASVRGAPLDWPAPAAAIATIATLGLVVASIKLTSRELA